MDSQQLDDHIKEMEDIHKAMKNVIEIVFATSPIMALSTHGWGGRTVNSNYLLRVSCIFLY